mgnify:CR=1 FL=1|jgi:hypothetical protein
MGRPCICCEKTPSESSSSSSGSKSESDSRSESISGSVSTSRSASSVSTSSNCPHCARCLVVNFSHPGAGGSSSHGLYLLHQDFAGTTCGVANGGIVYDAPQDEQSMCRSPCVTSGGEGDIIWLFEEHSADNGRGEWAYRNWISDCAWDGQATFANPNPTPTQLLPDHRAFWKASVCCNVVYVTTRDPATAVVVPESDPSALYIASKITVSYELFQFAASDCHGGDWPPKPSDITGTPVTVAHCSSANSFVVSALHIACSRNEVPNDDPIDQDNPNFMLRVAANEDSMGSCTTSDSASPPGCLDFDQVADFYFGPAPGVSWCPPLGSFDAGGGGGGGGGPGGLAPRMIYGSCEEIPCVYIGDGNGNWLPFQSCPNIEGQVCVCQPHPTEPSEYAGQMYVTNCGDAQ